MKNQIKELKRQNRSMRDKVKSIQPQMEALEHLMRLYRGTECKILPRDFKVRWCVYDFLDKSHFEVEILKDGLQKLLSKFKGRIEKNGKEILKLRGNKWSI